MLPFPPFTTLAASAGVTTLNRLLVREVWAAQRLSRHAGKTVRLALGQTFVSLTIANNGQVQVADTSIVPDVTLTLPAGQFGQVFDLLRHKDPEQLVEAMHIQGDAGLANVVADLARNLRWDVESDLAGIVGDIPAARLVSGTRAVAQVLQQAGERLAGNISEYFTEEDPLVVGRYGFSVLQADCRTLSRQLDQLEQRLTRLESSLRTRRP
ncbi:MAG: SCP2 domain-containing protein [Pusillimonas sp.]